jgi:hypothetical protein
MFDQFRMSRAGPIPANLVALVHYARNTYATISVIGYDRTSGRSLLRPTGPYEGCWWAPRQASGHYQPSSVASSRTQERTFPPEQPAPRGVATTPTWPHLEQSH